MDISVVIPVYNAERFLPEALASVMMQPEVKEILLVEDGSKDGSLAMCNAYARQHWDIVRVFSHPDGANRGAAATRNLGILNATCTYVAFLDADDLYLKERFMDTYQLFANYSDADGVYETVESVLFSPAPGAVIDPRTGPVRAGFSAPVLPEKLFSALAIAKDSYIHLNGLVMRRSALNPNLMFDPALRPCEDTDLMLRLAASCKLIGGDIDRVVSHRRVHDTNTVYDVSQAIRCRYDCMRKCALNNFFGSTDRKANREILNRMARATRLVAFARRMHLPVTPFRLLVIGGFLLRHPKVLRHVV